MRRGGVLVVALVFILGFGALTLSVVASQGVSVASIIALVVLALFIFGIVGALLTPPSE